MIHSVSMVSDTVWAVCVAFVAGHVRAPVLLSSIEGSGVMEAVNDPSAERAQRRLLVYLAQADGALHCTHRIQASARLEFKLNHRLTGSVT